MPHLARLYHSLPASLAQIALSSGVKAVSMFDDIGLEMRRDVVYCWLSKEDDKLSRDGQRTDFVYLEVTVETQRCTVADMEWSSLALMYLQGQSRPQNLGAARLLAEIYRVTSVPLNDYSDGMFFTPEVLVKGDIAAADLRLASA